MTSSGCVLYAELLPNIRQISIAASLDSPSDASTRVSVSADCRTVHLAHRGHTARLTLPGRAAVGGTLLQIQDKQKGTPSLSWRLPADEVSLPPPHHHTGVEHIPWSATDLETASGVACRHCGADVVAPGSVKVWKDLPSENWAEMMEFWHCHKPHHHHHSHSNSSDGGSGKADDKSLASRGYGASSAIKAQQGVGFVDLTSLLFAETDCRNLTPGRWHPISMAWVPIQMPKINAHWLPFLLTQAAGRSRPSFADGSFPPADRQPSALRQAIRESRMSGDFLEGHVRAVPHSAVRRGVADSSRSQFSWSAHDQGVADSQTLVTSGAPAGLSRNPNVFCSSCHAQLGFFNLRASAVTLLKWQVLCRSASGAVPTAPECLAATLIASAARSGSSKSLVTPMPDTMQNGQGEGAVKDGLHIWMLNSGIVYSSSGVSSCVPAIKLLFRHVSVDEADRMLASVTCDSQEINLPAQTIRQLTQHLEESSTLLPPEERSFKGWQVGLLGKWSTDNRSGT